MQYVRGRTVRECRASLSVLPRTRPQFYNRVPTLTHSHNTFKFQLANIINNIINNIIISLKED